VFGVFPGRTLISGGGCKKVTVSFPHPEKSRCIQICNTVISFSVQKDMSGSDKFQRIAFCGKEIFFFCKKKVLMYGGFNLEIVKIHGAKPSPVFPETVS
jgi:hypothetical protein